MPRTILIDGDIIVYQQAGLHQDEIDWGEGQCCVVIQDALARRAALDQVERYKNKLKADHVIVCLSDPKRNWRNRVYPEYKLHRKKRSRPVLYGGIRELLEEHYEVVKYPWLEADDVMGLLATDDTLASGERIIVSIDKDMKTVPGKLYNPREDRLGVQEIDPFAADFFFYKQVLMGDPVDGYFGVRGIGPKKAEKILAKALDPLVGDEHRRMWQAVVAAFKAAGMKEQDALMTARVARIIRKGEYDIINKRVLLWKPPK